MVSALLAYSPQKSRTWANMLWSSLDLKIYHWEAIGRQFIRVLSSEEHHVCKLDNITISVAELEVVRRRVVGSSRV